MSARARLAGLVLLALLGWTGATAAPARAGDQRWTRFGPGVGAVTAFTLDPQIVGTSYMAQWYGGVRKSVDGGRHWVAAGLPEQRVQELAAWRSSLFALSGNGWLYRSDDHAGRWTAVYRGAAFAAEARRPDDPFHGARLIFVQAATGPVFYLRLRAGVFRSRDEGRTWDAVLSLQQGEVGGLAADPLAPGTLYAGLTGQAEGQPAVLKSTDGGETWAAAGVPAEGAFPGGGVGLLEVVPARPSVVFASAAHPGLFRSADGGATWERVHFEPGVDYPVDLVAADPFAPSRVYATSSGNLWVSEDAGRTWRATPTAPWSRTVDLEVDPVTRVVYAASGLGIFRSPSGGRRWQSVHGITLAVDEIVFHPDDPARLFTVGDRLLRSEDGGKTWSDPQAGQRPVFLSPVRALEFAPEDPAVLYAATRDAVYRSGDGGQSWQRLGVEPDFDLRSLAALADGTLLAGACGIQRSDDGGRTWATVFPCIRPGTPDRPESTRFVLDLLAVPAAPETVYAEMGEIEERGRPESFWNLYRSGDGGRTWRRILADSRALAVDPGQPSRLVAVKLDATVVESGDGGRTWRRVGSLAAQVAHSAVLDLRIDPAAPSVLYAGTQGRGVFRSDDGGRTWAAVNEGLAPGNRAVERLFLHPTLPHRVYATAHQQVFGARF